MISCSYADHVTCKPMALFIIVIKTADLSAHLYLFATSFFSPCWIFFRPTLCLLFRLVNWHWGIYNVEEYVWILGVSRVWFNWFWFDAYWLEMWRITFAYQGFCSWRLSSATCNFAWKEKKECIIGVFHFIALKPDEAGSVLVNWNSSQHKSEAIFHKTRFWHPCRAVHRHFVLDIHLMFQVQ